MAGHKRQIKPGTWRFFVWSPPDPLTKKRKQLTRTFHGSERSAESALAKFYSDVHSGAVIADHAKVTVAQLMRAWLAHREPNLSPSTAKGYRDKIELHIVPHIGHLLVAKITTFDIDQLYAVLRERGLSASSVLNVHRRLHAAFEQARKWKWRPDNPVSDATPPSAEPRDEPAYIRELYLVGKAIDAASLPTRPNGPPNPLGDIAWLAAVTGGREGELCGLQLDDFDPRARTIRFVRRIICVPNQPLIVRPGTKTTVNKGRPIGLDRRTTAGLRLVAYRLRKRARACGIELDGSAYLFSEHPDGRPLSPEVVSKRWHRHKIRFGVTLTFHDLRHWHASVLDDENVPTSRISRRLGHARISTTSDMYTHVLRVSDHDLAEIASRRLRGR